jgi:hypothetical protein
MARVAVFWRWMGSLSKSFWIREDFFPGANRKIWLAVEIF